MALGVAAFLGLTKGGIEGEVAVTDRDGQVGREIQDDPGLVEALLPGPAIHGSVTIDGAALPPAVFPAAGGYSRGRDGVEQARSITDPRAEGVIVEIIGVLIAGLIIGLLGKFVAPGDRDNIPLWLTLLCGIAGVLIGYYAAAALGVGATPGIDWIRWIVSIIVAAILVIIAATVTGRRAGHRI